MLETWRKPIEREFEERSDPEMPFQIVEIAVNDGWWLSQISGLMTRFLKQRIPFERHTQVVANFDFQELGNALEIESKFVAYVFLIDCDGRIRWRASGAAGLDGAVLLVENLMLLIKENEQN